MYACGTETMKREGPDPTDGSILGFYPNPEAGNYIIPQNTNNMTLNVAEVYKILEKENILTVYETSLFLFLDVTSITATKAAKKNVSKSHENSGMTVVPLILTFWVPWLNVRYKNE